jgi:hypothetical protein
MRLSKTPSSTGRIVWRFVWAVTLAYLGLLGGASAHEIPNDVQVQSFLKQDEQGLRLFIRVPLSALKEVEFPLVKNLYLDIPNVKPALSSFISFVGLVLWQLVPLVVLLELVELVELVVPLQSCLQERACGGGLRLPGS